MRPLPSCLITYPITYSVLGVDQSRCYAQCLNSRGSRMWRGAKTTLFLFVLHFHTAPNRWRGEGYEGQKGNFMTTYYVIPKWLGYSKSILNPNLSGLLFGDSLFPDLDTPFLRDDFLNPLWVGRRRRKSKILRWEMTALNLPKDNTVRSITAKPISFWNQLAAEDIKKMISPPKSTKRQFVCLHKYFTSVLRSIGRHLEASDQHLLPHLPDIQWSEDIPICSFCSVTLNFIQSPDKIHRHCNHATFQSKDFLTEKLASCRKIIDDLANIIARL